MGPAFSGGFDGIASGIFISRVIHQMDVRVIAATHRDLKTEAAAGRFREDLFYRLHVFPVRMPARRERREDIPLLAAHFLEKHSRAFRRELKGFTPEALRTMTGYGWPGNVRELENAVERAVAVAGGTNVDGRNLDSCQPNATARKSPWPAERMWTAGIYPRTCGEEPRLAITIRSAPAAWWEATGLSGRVGDLERPGR